LALAPAGIPFAETGFGKDHNFTRKI